MIKVGPLEGPVAPDDAPDFKISVSQFFFFFIYSFIKLNNTIHLQTAQRCLPHRTALRFDVLHSFVHMVCTHF